MSLRQRQRRRRVIIRIVKRLPHTHRYGLTPFGLRTALFWMRSSARLLRRGMSELCEVPSDNPLQRALSLVDAVLERSVHELKLAS